MIFKTGTALYNYEIQREAGEDVMYINYIGHSQVPSLADSGIVMAKTIDSLLESPRVSKIVFVQQRNYVHTFPQVSLLIEIANLYNYFVKQERILSPKKLLNAPSCQRCLGNYHGTLRYLLLGLLKQDPIGCYVETKRIIREEKIKFRNLPKECLPCQENYVKVLTKFSEFLSKTKLVQESQSQLAGFHLGDRTLYNKFFRPDIVPNFTFTRLMSSIPPGSELLDEYTVEKGYDKSTVSILKVPRMNHPIYHMNPPEFSLDEEFYGLIDLARNVLIEHRPKAEEFTDPQRTRQIFFNISRDLLQELAEAKKISLSYRQLNKLASILVRHTIGFGLIEVLLQDDKLQDIVVNSPIGQSPIFIRHQKWDECSTNLFPSIEDAEAFAARFRMLSGRPLDEANPVLDTDLSIGNVRARVAIIQKPLSPDGIAYAFRRHREMPWTLPLFIKNKMLNPLAAGLISFLVDNGRTILVAGTRSAGKTSLLGSLIVEIMPKLRVIVIEDTLEMPADSLRKIGYNILRMKVRSALLKESAEMPADEGIRTSLRLGDSCLIIGEVRSSEAKALYEAMRIGALANVVAGTIHGASPYGVFDRVVNDLGVPITSFKATDIVMVANPIKTPDGLHSKRRLISLTEIRKNWSKDPLAENGFVDLLKYNVHKDELEATPDLINGESEILKSVASQVKGWAGNWDALWDNILLRARTKEELVKQSLAQNMPSLIEAPFVVKSNSKFHQISDKISKEIGIPEGKRVFKEWQEWLKQEIKKKKM